MFSVSLKSTPNSLKNFKSLRVSVPEIKRGGGWRLDQPSPQYKDVGIKHTSMGRIEMRGSFNSIETVFSIVVTIAISSFQHF